MRYVLLTATALLLLARPGTAGEVYIANYSGKPLYVATLTFTKAGSESTPAFSMWPNTWYGEGWKEVPPNGDRLIYSGGHDGVWVRVMQDDPITGTTTKPTAATKTGKFWVHGSRFSIEEDADRPKAKDRFKVKIGSDANKKPVATDDPARLGCTAVEFHLVPNNIRITIGTPASTKKKSYDFDFVANWDETKNMVRDFHAPDHGRVVKYKLEIDSDRGTRKVAWTVQKDHVNLNGIIAGTGNLVNQTRGRYKGTVVIEYIPAGSGDKSGLTMIDPDRPGVKVVPNKPLGPDDFKIDKGKPKPPPAPPPAAKMIKCTFTNGTQETVAFRINGGKGLSTTLAPGKSTPVEVRVDPGTPPAISIKQKNGTETSFVLADGEKYVFQVQNGKIVNAYNK